jgi:hypothetical protein
VWEAKEDRSYSLTAALEEIAEARKNRSAEMGVFVFSHSTAPEGVEPFTRYGNDFVIVWDADDPDTDILIRAAYSVSRCIASRRADVSTETAKSLQQIANAARAIERQVKYLEEFKRKGDIVKTHGRDISDRASAMVEDITEQLARLDHLVDALTAQPSV